MTAPAVGWPATLPNGGQAFVIENTDKARCSTMLSFDASGPLHLRGSNAISETSAKGRSAGFSLVNSIWTKFSFKNSHPVHHQQDNLETRTLKISRAWVYFFAPRVKSSLGTMTIETQKVWIFFFFFFWFSAATQCLLAKVLKAAAAAIAPGSAAEMQTPRPHPRPQNLHFIKILSWCVAHEGLRNALIPRAVYIQLADTISCSRGFLCMSLVRIQGDGNWHAVCPLFPSFFLF